MGLRYPKNGFTLIELVVVVALTAILFAATTTVMISVLRTEQSRTQQVSNVLKKQITRDLTNAEAYRLVGGHLMLRGPLQTDPSTRLPIFREGEVSYFVRHSPGASMLMRREQSQAGVFVEPAWSGVTSLTFETSYLEDEVNPGRWSPLPPTFTVRAFGIQATGAGQPPLLSLAIERGEQ